MTATVRSFDVFDTLLTRAVGRPTSLFLLMGRLEGVAAASGCSPEQWARTRVNAERLARFNRAEVTLDEIYTEIAAALCLDAERTDALQTAELALERRLSRVVPQAREMLVGTGPARRIAVSDMYLPGPFVEELLQKHGLRELLDRVVVSSASGSTKSSGSAYEDLLDHEGVRPRQVRHVGDHPGADVRVPRLLGLGAEHADAARLNRYEELWEDHTFATGGLASLVAGASRSARLHVRVADELRPVVDVAAGVAGPVLAAYVLWVLRSAEAKGVRRLYFLARDGEVLYQIAQRLIVRLGLCVELRYLHGSRSVYHRAALADRDLADASWAWKAMYGLTSRKVVARMGLSPDVAEVELRRIGVDPDAHPVSPDVIAEIVRDQRLNALVRREAEGLRDRLHDYLRQEGLCDPVRYGVVDTGWAGRIVQALDDALPPEASPVEHGWFFGYMDKPDGVHRPGVLRGYLFDEVGATGVRGRFEQAYGPIETFTVADAGMTVDFRREGGRVEPVLASPHNPVLQDWPWQLMRKTMLRFVDDWVLDADLAAVSADLRPAAAAVLDEFWSRPTQPEAAAWGRYMYEDDMLASSHNRLATPLSTGDFLRKSTDRKYEGKRLWLEGSVALTAPGLRPAAKAGLWANARIRTHGRARFALPDPLVPKLGLLRRALRSRLRARPRA